MESILIIRTFYSEFQYKKTTTFKNKTNKKIDTYKNYEKRLRNLNFEDPIKFCWQAIKIMTIHMRKQNFVYAFMSYSYKFSIKD